MDLLDHWWQAFPKLKLTLIGKVKVRDGEIIHGRDRWPLAGAEARVETAGEVSDRFTATRLALLGPFALAFKKKKDNRELYLTVEGEGFAFVVELEPSTGAAGARLSAT